MKDVRLTVTQKFIMLVIRCESLEHDNSDTVETPIRTFEEYGLKGHGNIKPHLNELQKIGYLLEVGTIKREDGYVVTGVRINRDISQTTQDDFIAELLPNQDIFTQDLVINGDSLEA